MVSEQGIVVSAEIFRKIGASHRVHVTTIQPLEEDNPFVGSDTCNQHIQRIDDVRTVFFQRCDVVSESAVRYTCEFGRG